MPTRRISALRPDHRISGNVLVEINGVRFSSLSASAVSELKLQENEELADAQFERLSHVADVEAAHHVALRLLAAQPRSVNEMLRRLRDRGHNRSASAEVVERLEANGLVNDHEFSRHFARVRLGRGYGAPRILTDLLSRGVERRLAERAIDEVVDSEGFDALSAARSLAEKRLSQLHDLPPKAVKRRLLGYLGRRGYRGWEISEMVDDLIRR